MMMSLLSWVKCFVAIMIVHTSFNYQGAEGNKTAHDGNCVCYDEEGGRIYDLSPLQRNDGQPRFTTASGEYEYGYNPCRSFSLYPDRGDCVGNVAICRWPKNKAHYQNIGKQSTKECGRNKWFRTQQLIYTNKKSFPNRQAIVNLRCDPSKKTPEEAEFFFISDDDNKWVFLVISNYACPNEVTTGSKVVTTSPKPPGTVKKSDDASKPELQFILPICALAFLVIAVPMFIYRQRIWQCIRGRNGNDDERRPFNGGGDVRPDNA